MKFHCAIRDSSLAALAGVAFQTLLSYLSATPPWTYVIAEWIMARTPSHYAIALLDSLGPWAKPFAATGGLALLGFAIFMVTPLPWWIGPPLAAVALGAFFEYHSWLGQLSFWIPAMAVLALGRRGPRARPAGRREFLTSVAMAGGVVAVAAESFLRNALLARNADAALFPFHTPAETFAQDLVRKAVTPTPEFYGMSKNTVDPAIDPRAWRLRITVDGRTLNEFSYAQLLSLARVERYVTLRCISNTLRSDLMGTAAWSGIHLRQIVERAAIPVGIVEAAVIGVDGHGDSFDLAYAFSDEFLLALGMNGRALSRTHGFPLRALAPRYYGFKNVKWISEIAFVSRPYTGTWPKLGYTRQPLIHTASHFDRVVRDGAALRFGGVSFAGVRGVKQVQVRADRGAWTDATLESPLSAYTWTRWCGALAAPGAIELEARALDGAGRWQESIESPLFPDGVAGPSIRRLS